MIVRKGNDINKIQLELLNDLLSSGEKVKVRGQSTIELFPVSFQLSNIRNRCTTLKERKWSIFYGLGEFCWHLQASDNLHFIDYYSKNWKDSSDDGIVICESCYGNKIFNDSLWAKLKEELTNDKFSRRAVINLYNNNDLLGQKGKKDVSCTIALQFLIRNSKLHMVTTMRSNDIIWGLPNDVFFFTLLQELLAAELGIETGSYTHTTGSLHLYERHFDLARRIVDNPEYFPYSMPKMEQVHLKNEFLKSEEEIRTKGILNQRINSDYWNELLTVLKCKYALKNSDYVMLEKLTAPSKYADLIKLRTDSIN